MKSVNSPLGDGGKVAIVTGGGQGLVLPLQKNLSKMVLQPSLWEEIQKS